MIVFYSIIAIFITWIWVEYFGLIDIFKKEPLKGALAKNKRL